MCDPSLSVDNSYIPGVGDVLTPGPYHNKK